MSFFAELKRRNVFRVAIAYALIAWVVLQVLDVVVGVVNAPPWVLQIAFFVGVIGLVAVVIISWVYEMTPEGIKKESEVNRDTSITPHTGRKLDRVIILFLALAVILLLGDRFINGGQPPEPVSDTASTSTSAVQDTVEVTPEDRSLAVLPFVAMSSGPDDEYFADGLTEEILNSLAQLPELLVTARTSAFSFKGQDIPVNQIAETLGVKHIVEGSVRRSGDRLRVTAQLIRADDGFHLWSDTYDSTSVDTIAVQEDIAEQIAVALNVVLDESKRQAMQLAGLRNVEAFVTYQKARYFYQAAHGELEQISALREANVLIEQVLELVPEFVPAYVEHSDLYAHMALNALGGFHQEGVTDEEIAMAMELAALDYDRAIEFARNEREKASFEYDRAFISGDWMGIAGRAAKVYGDQACTTNNWLGPFSSVFGYAADYFPFARRIRMCDPLVSLEWFNESRALMWAGNLEEAVKVAQQGSETAPGGWLNIQLAYALVASERYEDAERLVVTRMQHVLDTSLIRMLIASSRSDRDEAARQYAIYMQEEGAIAWQLIYHAWTGQREQANELAAQMDQKPGNSVGFATFLAWCACGAPFDLEYTPNFAAKLEESGLNWPPVSPINFPLKDW